MSSFTIIADAEFGPGYIAGRCTVCFDDGCMRPHRTLTREGYAIFLREVMDVGSDEEAVSIADENFGIGAGLGSFADMDAALGDRIHGGRGGWYGDEEFTGEATEGGEYYTEADGVLDWKVQNEVIFLTKKWKEGLLSSSPQDFEGFRQYIKAAWRRKVGDDTEIYGRMPWDGVDWDQARKQCFPPGATPFQPESSSGPRPDQSRPRSPPRGNSNPIPTLEQIETAPCPLTTYPGAKDYEKSRQHFLELWHRQKADCRSPTELRRLKSLMKTAWDAFVGPKGYDESMPWHDDFISPHPPTSSYQPLENPSPDSSFSPSDRRYESQKLAFKEEWEIMAHDKDATKRYALARLIQAAFATVVGPRSEEDDMPWTADLERSEPAPRDSAGREQSQSQPQPQNTPLPGTSLETDYATLRTEYAAIFLNRVKGEEREEVERVAGVFREAWVREVGVRAHDVRMPWDEVLAQQRDGIVEEGVKREVVGGGVGGKGRDGEGRRKGKKVEGWTRTRKGRSAGCEFQ